MFGQNFRMRGAGSMTTSMVRIFFQQRKYIVRPELIFGLFGLRPYYTIENFRIRPLKDKMVGPVGLEPTTKGL